MYYSFSSGANFSISGHFSAGGGCSDDCNGTAFPFPTSDNATIHFWLMDNQTQPKPKLYPVYINGKSDSFSLTVFGTNTSSWCITSFKTCSHSYSLTGTPGSTVFRTAQVNMSVAEGNVFPGQVWNRYETYSNFTGVLDQLTQYTCPSPASYQAELYLLLDFYVIPSMSSFLELGVEGYDLAESTISNSLGSSLPLVNSWLVSVGQYGANTPAFELGGGSSLPLLCENVYYTMIYADGGSTPQIYPDLENMVSLISTEMSLVNTKMKPNNSTFLSNLSSQNSTVAQSITDLSSLNSSLYSFVQYPSSCQVFTGSGDSSCAPYAQYIITSFLDPLGHMLSSDQQYTSSTLAMFKKAK